MNKPARIVAIILCILTLLGTIVPIAVNAEETPITSYNFVLLDDKTENNICLIDNETETVSE